MARKRKGEWDGSIVCVNIPPGANVREARVTAREEVDARLLHFKTVPHALTILGLVRRVTGGQVSFGVLSTGEKCAVALVLDRPDLAKEAWGTLLECAVRVGPDWLAAALYVQQNGWQEPGDDK